MKVLKFESVTLYPGTVQNGPPFFDAGIYEAIDVGETFVKAAKTELRRFI